MAKATRPIQRNEEHYVAKMNFRSEKILQSQIQRLNKEKLLQVKGLNAQIRSYERKLQKIKDRVLEVDKLSRNSSDPSQRLPTRDHFSKLSSDTTRQRQMATGVGYSYIDQLLGASKPLVSRPLRWGINPSLPSLQQQPSKPITLVSDAFNSKAFLTEIKGQPIYLRPREAVFLKRQLRPNALLLPPITLKQKDFDEKGSENSLIPRDSLSKKAKLQELDLSREDDEMKNQDGASQLSPIPEIVDETVPVSREARKNDRQETAEISGQKEATSEEEPTGSETSNFLSEPINIVVENSEPVLDKEMNELRSSSLDGHSSTECEFPTHGSENFTRSTELLHEGNDQQNENKSNSSRYELHARRFSL